MSLWLRVNWNSVTEKNQRGLAFPALLIANTFGLFNNSAEWLRIKVHAVYWQRIGFQIIAFTICFAIANPIAGGKRGGLCTDWDYRVCHEKDPKLYNAMYLTIESILEISNFFFS